MTKKTILIIIVAMAVCLGILGISFSKTAKEKDENPQVGLLPENEPEVVIENPETDGFPELTDEYMDRPDYTREVMNQIMETIRVKASSGEFDELDSYLEETLGKYKLVASNEEIDFDIQGYMNMVRSDISHYKALESGESTDFTFETPEMCAAAYIYLPISKKIDAPLVKYSVIYPPVSKYPALVNFTNYYENDYDARNDCVQHLPADSPEVIEGRVWDCVVYGRTKTIWVCRYASDYRWRVCLFDDIRKGRDNTVTIEYIKDAAEKAKVSGQFFDYDTFFLPEERMPE